MPSETIFNLSFPGQIPKEHVRLFNQIAVEIRGIFHQFIEQISIPYGRSLDWWGEGPASRNTYASPLFHYCCSIILVRRLLREGAPIDQIITDSKSFCKILQELARLHNARISIRVLRFQQFKYFRRWLKQMLRPWYYPIKFAVLHCRIKYVAWRTRPLARPLPAEPLTLIDTFIFGADDNNHYYPGLWENLTEQERKLVFFVPQFYCPRQLGKLLKKIRSAPINYLLKEDFLTWRDYIYAWSHIFRVRKMGFEDAEFAGLNMSALIREELRSNIGFYSAFLMLLNYRFFKRIKEKGIKIRLAVDWFENQVIDKGWNGGVRDFYPQTSTVGYQGFIVSAHYLCMFPTTLEKELKIIPKEVAVVGKGLIIRTKYFCPDLVVQTAPSFRFQGVGGDRTRQCPVLDYFTILVALPMHFQERQDIISIVSAMFKDLKEQNVRFWIKPHPTSASKNIIRGFSGMLSNKFQFVQGNLNFLAEQTDLLISSSSSSCLQLLANGVPVIVIGNQYGLTYNPIPEEITNEIWSLCYTAEETLDEVKKYQSQKNKQQREYIEIGKSIRELYFEPVTAESVRTFLKLDNRQSS